MWKGKITNELEVLASRYSEMFNGAYVDGYDELCYDAMGYEEFVGYIKEALRTGRELPYVVP